jgi:hypothetical protein
MVRIGATGTGWVVSDIGISLDRVMRDTSG